MFDEPALRLGMNERAQSNETNQQREAVARLASFCELLIVGGKLSGAQEWELRLYVNATCAAFNMVPVQERDTCA